MLYDAVGWQGIMRPHWNYTQERMCEHVVVLCIQESTGLDSEGYGHRVRQDQAHQGIGRDVSVRSADRFYERHGVLAALDTNVLVESYRRQMPPAPTFAGWEAGVREPHLRADFRISKLVILHTNGQSDRV